VIEEEKQISFCFVYLTSHFGGALEKYLQKYLGTTYPNFVILFCFSFGCFSFLNQIVQAHLSCISIGIFVRGGFLSSLNPHQKA
jgi:hypothetical protein